MPNDTILSPEKLRLLNQLKPFISRNPQILRMNESQFENWKSKSPTTEGLSYNDIQLYKEHTPLERTIYQAPRPGISSEEKPKITSLRQIKTSSQLAQWLSDYKQLLPQNVQQRIFLSRDDLAQKNVFYVKLWDQVRTLIPPDDFLKLEEATKSAKTENDVFNTFIYWRNHLVNRNLQLMLPDELAEAYRFWRIKHSSEEQKKYSEEKEVFQASSTPASYPVSPPLKTPSTPISHPISQQVGSTSSPQLNTSISQESNTFPSEAEVPMEQPTIVPGDEPQTFSNQAVQTNASHSIPPQHSPREAISSSQEADSDTVRDDRKQSSQQQSHQSPQDIERRINQAKERFEDIKNPKRVFDRANKNVQNKANNIRNMSQKATNGIKRLLKLGGKAGGIGEGGAVAAEGGAVATGAGAVIVETAPVWIPIVIILLLLLFVLILVILLIFAIWFTPGERFSRIIVQKSADKSQVPNPADAKKPEDTNITYTISATYDKKSSGINVYDVIPDNAEFASAEGSFTAYDAAGNIVSDPSTNKSSVKKIMWTVANPDYRPTSSSAPAGFPAGWPTTGQITQGPRGGTDHADLYNRTKAESIDIAYLATTPEYATFDGIVDTADFSCGNCNGKGFSYGNHVILTNTDKTFQVYYGHLLPQPVVSQGQQVKRGDIIGYMGSTGYSTGSHLHYEFRNLSLAPPYIPETITPDNCDPAFGIPCKPTSITYAPVATTDTTTKAQTAQGYWFQLHRSRVNGKQPTEELYKGIYGDKSQSQLVMTSVVNPGVDGKSPTPRPDLLGKSYWIITKKEQNQGDAINLMGPDFLVLNIEYQNEFNGPLGYNECGPSRNGQCFWPTPGEFGLHGTGNTPSRLTDSGSSGCVRHSNDSITSIYNLLKNESGEIRYYISED